MMRPSPSVLTWLALSAVCACADPRAPGASTQAPAPWEAPLEAAASTASPRASAVSPHASGSRRRASGPEGTGHEPVARGSAASPRAPTAEELARYGWLLEENRVRALVEVFAPPPGFTRVELAPGSFGAFLRGLPLRAPGTAVHTFDGDRLLEADDPRIAAVVELDVGRRDLQQCADTAIRLHAEWLWSRGEQAAIGYHFTSGDLATWSRHQAGDRPVVDGKGVTWARSARATGGRPAFRAWLDLVFSYAGTVSLAREAARVDRLDVRPGDFFVLPGGPGHAVMVLDVARDAAGRRVALLGQGFMPAQDAHVLAAGPGAPWFDLEQEAVDTPFWPVPFPWSSLRRMRTASGRAE